MTQLPTGTVALLFSDIEGSTRLLGRLGSAYAEVLDSQREVLRSAWRHHAGTELGTEGDSFFVAFPTADQAVAAAVESQRGLAAHAWPSGEQVRVRMGIHTGTPTIHDGEYVGMDVHRAARIAGVAHGEQVVLSEVTAKLSEGALPTGVGLRDLGSHRLKDIEAPEHLFQLTIDGVRGRFPSLKSLGAATRLPTPTTALVGRDGELAELVALLETPGVRLATLTGPGGAGKTRLAIGTAGRLGESFPDGIYFVPLASVTTAEVMWSSIAEVLDVPPEARTPAGVVDHLQNRAALLLLDNLEQLPGASGVVAELLAGAPQLIVLATSRRPLHLAGEHEHAVPGLELPEQNGEAVASAEQFGAVQMFVEHARMVRPRFELTPDNTADVVALCRALDALPLAIELAASRSKLLSPRALLTRVFQALELSAPGVDRPSRQQTLRQTIAWSYDLLTPQQQDLLRRLSVFAGGADLDAVSAVSRDGPDPLDAVAELVDTSLVTVDEDERGEPRVALLETIRVFARDELAAAGELESVRQAHAVHYLAVADQILALHHAETEDRVLEARTRFRLEDENFREALSWALDPHDGPDHSGERLTIGLRLCGALCEAWHDAGNVDEGRRWAERAIAIAGDEDSPELADCLRGLGFLLSAHEIGPLPLDLAQRSLAMWRRLGDQEQILESLLRLMRATSMTDDLRTLRQLDEEAVDLARDLGAHRLLAHALCDLSSLEANEGHLEHSLALSEEAVEVARSNGFEVYALMAENITACTLREMNRRDEARALMTAIVPAIVRVADGGWLLTLAEDYGAVLADTGNPELALRLLGAVDAARERERTPRGDAQSKEIHEPFSKARSALSPELSARAYADGLGEDLVAAIRTAYADSTPS